MDYKKIIAATAVTSAAFVVPVVAGAEGTTEVKSGLITEEVSSYGKIIQAAVTEFEKTNTLADGTEEKVTDKVKSYEWKYKDSGVVVSKTNQFKVPLNAQDKTVVLTVTTESGAKYSDEVKIDKIQDAGVNFGVDTSALINTSIDAYEFNLPKENAIIKGYEWYIYDELANSYKLITSSNDLDVDVLPEYQGKQLMVLFITEDGEYFASTIEVEKIDVTSVAYTLSVNGKSIDDVSEIKPGDVLQVSAPEITESNGAELDPTDYLITYRWLAVTKSGDKVILPNANTAALIVPVDSNSKKYKSFEVEIVFKLLVTGEEKSVTIGTALLGDFDTLINDIKEAYGEFEKGQPISAKLTTINDEYNALSTTSKPAILNSNLLTEMNNAYKVLQPLIKEFKSVEADRNIFLDEGSTIKQSDLLKRVEKLNTSYSALSKSQRNLFNAEVDSEDGYLVVLADYIKKFNSPTRGPEHITYEAINNLNTEIQNSLFGFTFESFLDVIESGYAIHNYNDNENNIIALTSFETEIKRLLAKVNTFNKTYQSLIQTELLKTAQTDIKKAKLVLDKMVALEKLQSTDAKKYASSLASAQKAYDKLTALQASLIIDKTILESNPNETVNPSTPEVSDKVETINTDISNLFDANGNYTDGTIELKQAIEEITLQYKVLSSTEKKQVDNYKAVSQAKKDVAAAKKVTELIAKAYDAQEEAAELNSEETFSKYISKMKSAQSKFSSAHKSYVKLTQQQLNIVHLTEATYSTFLTDFKSFIENDFTNNDIAGKTEYDTVNSEKVIDELSKIEEIFSKASAGVNTTDNDLYSQLESNTNVVKALYKTLNPYEKKLVYNYGVLANATSNLSKAKSVKTRLEDISSEADYKKFISAKTAFDKLTDVQKGLIINYYKEAMNLVEYMEGETLESLNERIGDFVTSYDNLNELLGIQKSAQVFSTTELKTMKNYNVYQTALKDLKAVEGLISKIDKLTSNPTYSQKDSIIKAYQKLTANQQKFFANYERPDQEIDLESPRVLLESMIKELQQGAMKFDNEISEFIDEGKYSVNLESTTAAARIAEFKQKIEAFKASYKALDSKERKLVINYSYISTAEKDLKVIENIKKIKDKLDADESSTTLESQFEKAYEKLTPQQTNLFDIIFTN